jgi:hypothetical protein
MAERTLAEVATAKRPSMVAGTEEEAFMQFIDVRGPYKVETLYLPRSIPRWIRTGLRWWLRWT